MKYKMQQFLHLIHLCSPLISPISFLGWFPLWRQTSFPAICSNFHSTNIFCCLEKVQNSKFIFLTQNTKSKICKIGNSRHLLKISTQQVFFAAFKKVQDAKFWLCTAVQNTKCIFRDILLSDWIFNWQI